MRRPGSVFPSNVTRPGGAGDARAVSRGGCPRAGTIGPLARSAAALLLATLAACSDTSPPDERLFVSIEQLVPLESAASGARSDATGFEYVLWRDDGARARALGRFDAPRGVVNLSLPVDDLDAIRTLFVTIERAGETVAAPRGPVLLAGDMIDGGAVLDVAHRDALGTDFLGAVGTYRLETPTSRDEDDFAQGLWWYDGDIVPTQSLFLPDLPQGWLYEGWIVGGDGMRSTGKFADPARFDVDAGGTRAGGVRPPPFPGQDYVTEPFSVAGLSAMITIEPDPDTASTSSGLRILFDQVVEELRVNQPMQNVTGARLPFGRATTNRS